MIANIVRAGMGLLSGIAGSAINTANQQKIMNMQYSNQRALNEQGRDLALDIWNRTNYEAQVAHMKNAGLNPALMYTNAGFNGATAGNGGNAAGGQAQSIDILGQMRQMAEIDLIKAQTKDVETTTEQKTGIEHEIKVQEFNNLVKDLENKDAQIASFKIDKQYKELEYYIRNENKTTELNLNKENLNLIKQNVELLLQQNDITEQTKKDIIENQKLQNQKIIADIIETQIRGNLENSQISVNKANINKMAVEVYEIGRKLVQEDERIRINAISEYLKSQNIGVSQVVGKAALAIGNIINTATNNKTAAGELEKYIDKNGK